jgi:hypothetical protein
MVGMVRMVGAEAAAQAGVAELRAAQAQPPAPMVQPLTARSE